MGSLARWCKLAYYGYLSQPASDRLVYRLVGKHRVRKILELGIGTGRRTMRMLDVIADGPVGACYTGIDLFEMRSAGSPSTDGLSLKSAHRQLRSTGAKVRLVPGQPFEALSRSANDVGPCDLIVISADQDRDSLARAWFYLPRLLHAATHVCLEEGGTASSRPTMRLLSHAEVARLAAAASPRRAA